MKRKRLKITPNECCQYILIEYAELRQEIRFFLQGQISVLTIYISISGVLLGLIAANTRTQDQLVAIVCFSLAPGVSAFFGVLFLDLVFRQRCLGHYIAQMEESLMQHIVMYSNFELPTNVLCWETNLEQDDHKFFAAKRLKYYLFLGLFLVSPPFATYIGYDKLAMSLYETLHNFMFYIIIGCVSYALFLFFAIVYIVKILRIAKI